MARRNGDNLIQQFEGLKQDWYGRNVPARSDYAATTPSRFRRTRTGLGGSGDAHYANETSFLRMREYVRDMERNDPIIKTILDRATDNQVQTGSRIRANTGDLELDRDLNDDFDDWSRNPDRCDLTGERAFSEIEWLVARTEMMDGDLLVLPLKQEGSLQIVEAHRLRTPTNTSQNVVHGVLLDRFRKPLQYWLCPDTINPLARWERVSDARKIDARDEDGIKQVFHVAESTRFTLTRGVPAFHAIFDKAGMYEDADFAQLVKEQFAACVVAFLKREGSYQTDFQGGERTEQQLPDGTTATLEGMTPGQFIRGKPGEDLKINPAGAVSQETMAHMRNLLMIIGANLGMPLAMILLDGSEGSFSTLRFIFDQAKIGFMRRRERRRARFQSPVWRFRAAQVAAESRAVRAAKEKLGPKFFGHTVNFPGWPYIQPLHDAEASIMRMSSLQTSPTHELADAGLDFNTMLDEIVRDRERAVLKAHEAMSRVLELYPAAQVTWRDFLHLDIYKGGQVVDIAENPNVTDGSQPAGKKKN